MRLGRGTLLAVLLAASLALVVWHNAVWQDAGAASRSESTTDAAPSAESVDVSRTPSLPDPVQAARYDVIQLCQALSPADPHPIPAIDCVRNCPPGYEATWDALGPVASFQEFGQGEYVGRARLPHVPTYRLRVDDQMEFVFRVTRNESPTPYKLNVGDEVSVESTTDPDLRRSLVILPDGTVTLPLIGQVRAAGMTVDQLRESLDKHFERFYNQPGITVTPTKVDTKLEDLRYTVSGRSGFGGQVLPGKVTPEGTIQLPVVGSVPAQGLTLDEFQSELAARFAEKIEGIEVVPVLKQRAPRYVYVLGEVAQPGRYTLEQPTTVMQSIAMAGSWNYARTSRMWWCSAAWMIGGWWPPHSTCGRRCWVTPPARPAKSG